MAASAKAPAIPARADYGLDAPRMVRTLFTRGVILILLGFGLWIMNRVEAPGGGAALFAALGLIGAGFAAAGAVMVWSSRAANVAMRERILNALTWRGDEKVLDVGCGRGLMLIGAAKRLKSGKATGVDVWNAEDLSGNNADATVANARAEGVLEKVKIENGDARRLQYQANTYDIVLSSLALHNIKEEGDRTKALDEIWRVTRPGGQIALWDVFHAGDYLQHFQSAGAELVQRSGTSFLWCVPGRWFIVRKKA
jgi:SAM-dependent methyltransferase